MKQVILYTTLLMAFTVDHFYQIGKVAEARHATERAEQATAEAYVVTDALLTKYERLESRNCYLEDRAGTLAKANRMMIDRMSARELNEVMEATLSPLGRGK